MYDAAVGRFHTKDRFAEKYFAFSPYQYAGNNPILNIDINGDSIYIFHDKERILYVDGNLFWAGTGKAYDGQALNKKGNLKRGFIRQAKEALDKIRTGGDAGKELIDFFQYTFGRDIGIQRTRGGSKEQGGLIFWNPTGVPGLPNSDGTSGRKAFIGLAHEMGHTWNRVVNGRYDPEWYIAADGKSIPSSEKVATWWENRVRAEHKIGLREFYSYTNNNGVFSGEEQGRILINGTRQSRVNNQLGGQIIPLPFLRDFSIKGFLTTKRFIY